MTVVVGYIATPQGRAALARGIEEARLRGATLVVVHSIKGGASYGAEESLANRTELDRVRAELAATDLEFDVRELVVGNEPAEDLVAVAEETGAELLVIGMRRRSPVGKFVMGSNAQRIMLDANCPVLAVKAD